MQTSTLGKIDENGFDVNLEALEDLPHIRELLANAEHLYHADSASQDLAKQQSRFRELPDTGESLSPLGSILLALDFAQSEERSLQQAAIH